MPKVLAQAGTTLADVYDVEGSVAGVEELLSSEVHLSHEMGATIFSERFSQFVRRVVTGNLAQNIEIAATLSAFPGTPCRINGVCVLVDTAGRVDDVAVNVKDNGARELPIWVWDGTNTDTIRLFDVTLGDKNVLRPNAAYSLLPNIVSGPNRAVDTVDDIVVRGTTSGFGAGTVEITLLVFISFAARDAVSSQGLPIPGW